MRLVPRRILAGAVRVYQLVLSPWLGSVCRFTPSCSHYAIEALGRHGASAGTLLTLGRLARCQPWCAGGHDGVPAAPWRPFTSLRSRAGEPHPPASP